MHWWINGKEVVAVGGGRRQMLYCILQYGGPSVILFISVFWGSSLLTQTRFFCVFDLPRDFPITLHVFLNRQRFFDHFASGNSDICRAPTFLRFCMAGRVFLLQGVMGRGIFLDQIGSIPRRLVSTQIATAEAVSPSHFARAHMLHCFRMSLNRSGAFFLLAEEYMP